jgi:hypothetical protein
MPTAFSRSIGVEKGFGRLWVLFSGYELHRDWSWSTA